MPKRAPLDPQKRDFKKRRLAMLRRRYMVWQRQQLRVEGFGAVVDSGEPMDVMDFDA